MTLRCAITRHINDIALVDVVTTDGRVQIYVGVPGSAEGLPLGTDEKVAPLTDGDKRYAWDKAKAAAEEFLREAEIIDA
jgi:hypothetical protein